MIYLYLSGSWHGLSVFLLFCLSFIPPISLSVFCHFVFLIFPSLCLSVFYLVISVHISSSLSNLICLSFSPFPGGTGLWSEMFLDHLRSTHINLWPCVTLQHWLPANITFTLPLNISEYHLAEDKHGNANFHFPNLGASRRLGSQKCI